MAKVFISYSRKDIEFAKKLTAELAKSDLDFWVDWEGIPPTVDWWRQIEIGIEEADTFIFLISPDSAASKVCGREIDHAIQNGKRLIPLVVRETKGDETPKQLGHLNWIFFRASDDFDAAIKKLLTSIQTDYEWVQVHRELQVKALEWERGKRDKSFLLRGKDLQDAEAQLAVNTSKQPHPTDLQRDFIFQSRQAVDRQRRVMTGISAVAVIVMAFLAVYGLTNAKLAGDNAETAIANLADAQTAQVEADTARGTAVANESLAVAAEARAVTAQETAEANAAEAERQAKIALSRQLSSQANLLQEQEFDTTLLLALAGVKNLDTTSGRLTLMSLLESQPTLVAIFRGFPSDIEALAFSPDGNIVGAIGCTTVVRLNSCPELRYEIRLWDLASHQMVGNPIPMQMPYGFSTLNGDQIAVSVGGAAVAIRSDVGGTVEIWNPADGSLSASLPGGSYAELAFSPAGLSLATLGYDGTLALWDITLEPPGVSPRATAYDAGVSFGGIFAGIDHRLYFSPDGASLALAGDAGSVHVWNVSTGARRDLSVLGGGFREELPAIYGLAFTADSRSLAAWISFEGFCDSFPLNIQATYFSSAYEWCVRAELVQWDLDTLTPTSTTIDQEPAYDQAGILSPYSLGLLSLTPFSDETKYSSAGTVAAAEGCISTAVRNDFNYDFICLDGYIKIYTREPAPRGRAYLEEVPGFTEPSGPYAFTGDGGVLTLVDEASWQLANFDAATGRLLELLPIPAAAPGYAFVLNTLGDLAFIQDDGAIFSLNLASPETGQALPSPQTGAYSLSLSDAGHTLLSMGDQTVNVWDVQAVELILSFDLPASLPMVYFYLLSPDGRYLVFAEGDAPEQATLTVWDLQIRAQIQQFTPPEGIGDLSLSPDGKLANGLHNQLIVFDIRTGERLVDISWPVWSGPMWFGGSGETLFVAPSGVPNPGETDGYRQQELWDLVGFQGLVLPIYTSFLGQSLDERFTLMRDEAGKLFIWQTNYADWQEQVCLIANRNLTPSEWKQYIGDILPYQALCPDLPLEPAEAAAP